MDKKELIEKLDKAVELAEKLKDQAKHLFDHERMDGASSEEITIAPAEKMVEEMREFILKHAKGIDEAIPVDMDKAKQELRDSGEVFPNSLADNKYVRVMCDYCADGVWDIDGASCDTEDLPVTNELKDRIKAWQVTFDSREDWQEEPTKTWLRVFNLTGMSIAYGIKRQLPDWKVVFFNESSMKNYECKVSKTDVVGSICYIDNICYMEPIEKEEYKVPEEFKLSEKDTTEEAVAKMFGETQYMLDNFDAFMEQPVDPDMLKLAEKAVKLKGEKEFARSKMNIAELKEDDRKIVQDAVNFVCGGK